MKWPTVILGDLCSTITKGTTPRTLGKEYVPSGIPFIRAENLQGNEIILEDDTLYIDKETNRLLSRSVVLPGDVLISIAGTIGRCAIVPDNAPPMNCNQAVAIVRISGPIDKRFLLHWLKSHNAQHQMFGAKVTLTISNLSLTQIKNLKVPLPPLSEQRRIVEILDQADALRKKRAEADSKAERIVPTLFYKMFGDPATNPMKWEILSFFDAAEDVSAGQPKTQKKNFLLDGLYPIVDQGQNDIAGYTNDEQQLFRGQLPVIIFGDHTLTFKYVDFPFGIGADGVRVLRAHPGFHPLYLFHALRLLHLHSVGYSRHFKFLKESRLMRPPKQEQDRFAQCAATIHFELSKMNASRKVISDLFGILLHRAFSGDLTAEWRNAHMKELLIETEEQAKILKASAEPN